MGKIMYKGQSYAGGINTGGGGGGGGDSAFIPTANTDAQFDGMAQLNSTDMTLQEIGDFVGDLTTEGFNFIDFFYPVGSYYETSDGTFNPNTTWGGTWELENEGLVHIGSGTNYTLGSTGGEATHLLTVNEIPSHKHDELGGIAFSGYSGWPSKTTTKYGLIFNSTAIANSSRTSTTLNMSEIATNYTGGGTAHNNMQPYKVVNRWHRTA